MKFDIFIYCGELVVFEAHGISIREIDRFLSVGDFKNCDIDIRKDS